MIDINYIMTDARSENQRTWYVGTQDELLETGCALPHMFDVGKSGTRMCNMVDNPLDAFTTKKCGKGKWEVRRTHPIGEPPHIPDHDIFIENHEWVDTVDGRVNHRHSLFFHTAWIGEIETETYKYDWSEDRITCYTGTKRQLILAGLATAEMFPIKIRMKRKGKTSPEHLGNWQVRVDYSEDRSHPLSRWCVTYNHDDFETPPEVMEAQKVHLAYQILKRRFEGDDGEAFC